MPDDREIIIRPLPFKQAATIKIAHGLTLAAMVEHAFGGKVAGVVLVDLNGEPVIRDKWGEIVPAENDHVLIYTPIGKGGNALRSILSIVVIAAVSYVSGPAGPSFFGSTYTAAAAGAFVATAGMLLVNAIAPARNNPTQQYNNSPSYSINGGSNKARPFGPIPLILGRHKVYPDYAAKPYTEIVGNDEYLRMLFCWGYGRLKIENIKIGDTPITSYDDVEIQTYEGKDDDPDISLYPSVVNQTSVGVDLDASDGWVTRTVAAGADEISWDIEFPRGLLQLDVDGNRLLRAVALEMQYKSSAASNWTSLSGTVAWSTSTAVNLPAGTPAGTHSIFATVHGTIVIKQGTSNSLSFKFAHKIGELVVEDVEQGSGLTVRTVTSVTDLSNDNVTGLNCSELLGAACFVSSGSAVFDAIQCSEKTQSAVRRGFSIDVDSSYSCMVRIRRVTADSDSTRIVDECQWKYIRSITNGSPVDFDYPFALTAVRIKASGQLNGIIEDLNGICTSYAEIWNGSTWTGSLPTQNPAALARLVLMGNANHLARTSSQMDEDAFGDWYELCASQGYKFNMVRDFRASAWDSFADICATARAAPALSEGKWSVIIDHSGKGIAQHITPRNSWGFSSVKTLFDAPHAFRVKFKNEDQVFEWDERIVYDDGYSTSNAIRFKGIELPGITDPDLIWKFARYYIAQARLRPEEYTLYMDFEHLACSRGDLVRVSHDISEWGLGWGRVKSLVTSGSNTTGVILDEHITMKADASYVTRFRLMDNSSLVISITTAAGETNELSFATTVATASGPAAGDLFMFGEADSESAELLVKKIERQNDYVAKLTLVDYAKDIYSADTGTIPDFDSNVTEPIDITKLPPATPVITNIESGTAALEKVGSTIRARMLVTVEAGAGSTGRISQFRVRYRIQGATNWSYVTCAVDDPTAIISNVIESETYQIGVQAISIYGFGVVSAWSAGTLHTVVGSTAVPSDISSFRIEVVGTTAYLQWSAVTDLDLLGYKIKFSSATSDATWSTAVPLIDLVPAAAVSIPVAARQGSYLIKAIDRGERESTNALSVVNAYGDIQDMNVVETATEHSAFSGTHDRTEVSGSVLQLANLAGVLEWDESAGMVLSDEGGVVFSDGAGDTDLSEGYYYFANSVDLGAVYTSRVSASMISGGVNLVDDLFYREDFFDVDDFFGVLLGQWSIKTQLRSTNDDPTASPTWTDWKTFTVSDVTARSFQFRVLLESLATGISPAISELSVEVDMPDRVISEKDLTVPAIGLHITFYPAFKSLKGIGIAVQDLDTGDYWVITNKSESGFDINFYDSTDTGVERSFDHVSVGYGRVTT